MKKILLTSLLLITSHIVFTQEVEEVIVKSSLTDADRQLSEIGDPIHVLDGDDPAAFQFHAA